MIKISIITAVFNRESTVGEALDSVTCQTYPNIESIVIDGASSDGTLAILRKYSSHISNLISEPDNGIYDALNKGIKLATGDVVGFLHADDVFENSEVIAKVASIFLDPAVDAIYGDLVYVRHNNLNQVIRYWKSGPYNEVALKRGWMPPHPTFYVRRSVYDRYGAFDMRYRIAADYDNVLRLLAVKKINTVYLPEILVRMRAGGISNRSIKTIIQKSLEDIEVLRRNGVGGIWTFVYKNLRKISQFWNREGLTVKRFK